MLNKVEQLNFQDANLTANLLGDFRNQQEVMSVTELLLEVGIEANYLPPHRMKQANYQGVHLNINHFPASEVIIQKRTQSRYGRPYLTVSFFGPSEVAGALRDIGVALGLPSTRVEKTVREGLLSVTESINSYGAELYRKKVLLLMNDHQKEIVGRVLDDLGMKVVNAQIGRNQHVTREMLVNVIRNNHVQLVISDSEDVYYLKTPFLSLPNEKQSFLGFSGFANFAGCISSLLQG